MARPVSILDITETERMELQRRLNSPTTAQRDSLRAAIVLRRGEGITQQQVAKQLGVSKACVNKWSQRFEREGLEGLEDRKGRGRPASIPAHKVEQVITRATQPPHPRQRWSVRTMAKAVGISPDSVPLSSILARSTCRADSEGDRTILSSLACTSSPKARPARRLVNATKISPEPPGVGNTVGNTRVHRISIILQCYIGIVLLARTIHEGCTHC